jgi:ATP/maltotriose-dependent transcriptional regulator MalT
MLPRPRLTQRLLAAADYSLTVVQAGAGYGKSTTLAALANEDIPLIWYHLLRDDADPLRFLLYLLQGLASAFGCIEAMGTDVTKRGGL